MVDPRGSRRLAFRMLFVGLAGLVILVQILPLNTGADHLPAPDLLILLCFAWALRRPDYLPTLLTAAVLLAADILLMRPLGLGAAIGLLAVESLRRRGQSGGELPFPAEWVLVSGVLTVVMLVEVVILGLLLVPQPPIGATALQLALSVAVYPIVALATGHGFGVRPASPAERDAMAGRP